MLIANNRGARNCSVQCGPILRAASISRPLTAVSGLSVGKEVEEGMK